MAQETSASGTVPELHSESARRVVHAWERVFREEITKMGNGLSAALKAALNFEAILKEAVDVEALRRASKAWGQAVTEGIRDGLKPVPGEGAREGADHGGSEKKDAPSEGEGNGKGGKMNILLEILKNFLDLETPLKLREEAEKAGLPMRKWQAWLGAARETKADAEGDKLEKFFERLLELMEKTDTPNSPFKTHGVSASDPNQAALDLAEIFGKADETAREELLKELKIDKDVEEKLLRMGPKKLNELVQNKYDLGGYTEEDAEKAFQVKNRLADLNQKTFSDRAALQGLILDMASMLFDTFSAQKPVEPPKLEDASESLKNSMDGFLGFFKTLGGAGNWTFSAITANLPGMRESAWETVDGLKMFGGGTLGLFGQGLRETGISRRVDTPYPDDFTLDPLDNLHFLKDISNKSSGPEFSSFPYMRAGRELVDIMADVMEMTMGIQKPNHTYMENPVPIHETTVNVGEVTVNTQATDVWAISRDLSAALADTIPRNIVDAADSGVAR